MASNRIKILFITSTLADSGPITVLYNIVKYLDFSAFEPIVLTLSPEPRNSAKQLFADLKVQVITLGLTRLKSFFFAGNQLSRLVMTIQPSIVHSHGIRADVLSALFINTSLRISTLHNYPYEDYVMSYGKIKGDILAWAHIKSIKKLELSTIVSSSMAAKIYDSIPNIAVVQNGIDRQIYYPVAKAVQVKVRRNLGLSTDRKIFISVGHLNRRKDPHTVISGFLNCKAKDSGMLLMIGDGPLRQTSELIAGSNNNVAFLGQVKNVVEFLQASDYFLSASLAEGLPNSVMEAMACGLPVCLSKIDSHKEILNLNLDAGYCFDIKDVGALSQKIDRMLETEYESMSTASLSIIRNYLNARRMSEKYMDLYLSIHSISGQTLELAGGVE